MYTDLQINAIRAFGDKELKDGCFVLEYHFDEYYDDDGNTCGSNDAHILGKVAKYGDIDIYIGDKIYTYDDGKICEYTELLEHDDFFSCYPTLWSSQLKVNKDTEILGNEPNLFPDVAKKLREKGYNLEVLQGDTLTSIIRISRWDIKKPQIIEYKPCLPLLEQPKAMESLLALIK